MSIATAVTEHPPADFREGYIESARAIPLEEALFDWRREAEVGELDFDRYRCRYFVWGRGQPLLFVHGLSEQARSFVPLIAHLTNTFRCIAYELPNGDGDGARFDHLHHCNLVADAISLLDHLNIGQACLYGASFGGLVVLGALRAQPRRFLRAAIQSGFAHRRLAPAERIVASLARYWPGRMADLPLRNWLQRNADSPTFAVAPRAVWEFQRANTASLPIRAFAHRVRIISETDLRATLPSIMHPILLIGGDRDSSLAHGVADELAAGLPHVDRLEFSNCGHHAQYTHAAGVAAALQRFLLPPCGLSG